jgi:serine/threonine protein kinase
VEQRVLVPPSKDQPEPDYPDDESRELSQELKALYQRRKELVLVDADTQAVRLQIANLRCRQPRTPQLQPGEFLADGRFELVQVLGLGGFATVWKAWDAREERVVALKVLHAHHGTSGAKLSRFERGARKMAEFRHPHIVRVLESKLFWEGWHYFVMEYIGGGNLDELVLTQHLTDRQRLTLLLQVGAALEYAHDKGVVHRDVKPSNILVDEAGAAKLTDFDLAQADDTEGFTRTQTMMGTLLFAAPEALVEAKNVGPNVDVYSLGATASFVFLGTRLPPDFYRNPSAVVDKIPCAASLKVVLKRALGFEASGRFDSASTFFQGLKSALVAVEEILKPDHYLTKSLPILSTDAGFLG